MGERKARTVERTSEEETLRLFSFLVLVRIRDPAMGNLQSGERGTHLVVVTVKTFVKLSWQQESHCYEHKHTLDAGQASSPLHSWEAAPKYMYNPAQWNLYASALITGFSLFFFFWEHIEISYEQTKLFGSFKITVLNCFLLQFFTNLFRVVLSSQWSTPCRLTVTEPGVQKL